MLSQPMTQVQSVIRRLSNVDDKEKTKEHDIGRETTEEFLGLRISGGQLVQTKKILKTWMSRSGAFY